jgi:DNA-binding LacI/PurR family transcriptional regulator
MSAPPALTQRDVAQACGLHPSTVCLALKNDPSIPEATRQRIQATAAELGYQPNVAARNLALLRTDRHRTGSMPIGWINQEPRRDHWRNDPAARVYFESARARAAESGYHLEEIWTREAGMNGHRVAQIVRARGIAGAIFPAHHESDFSLLNHDWRNVALVGCNDHRLGEWVDVVCPDYYRNAETTLSRLRRLGFERIGLVLSPQFDAATQGLVHAAYLRFAAEVAPDERVPVCFLPATATENIDTFVEWFRDHGPDVIIGADRAVATQAEVPHVPLNGISNVTHGIDCCAAEIAAAAIDCVVEKMRRFETGTSETARMHLIRGVWHEPAIAARPLESVVA